MPNVSHLLTVAALAAGLGDNRSLEHVLRARSLLADNTWTEVIRIENAAPASPYPKVVYALVFQMNTALWFYTPTDGTQSLSHFQGRAEADKLDLGRLLVSIDRGFTHWETVPETAMAPERLPRLPNGCFIESLAILFDRLASGNEVQDPRLLSYYVNRPEGVRGHTVLQFEAGGRTLVIDPDWPTRLITIRYADAKDPMSVVYRMRRDVAKARHLSLDEFLARRPQTYSSNVVGLSNRS
jgi:hypothetical protein